MTRKTRFDGYEYDPRLYRAHVCPNDGNLVLPFADGSNNAHCISCGIVTYASMMEYDVPAFREAVTQPAHAAEPEAWQVQATADHADWLDEKRTQEDAR
jgi:hypothetical protein